MLVTGVVAIKNRHPDGVRNGTLNNVLYVSGLGGDLLSLGTVADLGIEVRLTQRGITLERDGKVLMSGARDPAPKGLYYMDIDTVHQPVPAVDSLYSSSIAAVVKVNRHNRLERAR